MTAQDFAGEHPRQNNIVGKLRLTGAFRASIDLAKRLPDHIQFLSVLVAHEVSMLPAGINDPRNHRETNVKYPVSFRVGSWIVSLGCVAQQWYGPSCSQPTRTQTIATTR